MNDRNTAYVASALRDHDIPARSHPFLATTASRSWLRRTTVAGALAIGDVLVVFTVLRLSGLVLGENSHHLGDNLLGAFPMLIGIYWVTGLYTGSVPHRLNDLGCAPWALSPSALLEPYGPSTPPRSLQGTFGSPLRFSYWSSLVTMSRCLF